MRACDRKDRNWVFRMSNFWAPCKNGILLWPYLSKIGNERVLPPSAGKCAVQELPDYPGGASNNVVCRG